MLSIEEVDHINNQLQHIPDTLPSTQKRSLRRDLNKQLQEHKYASRYPPYQPTPYEIVFINRITTSDVLIQLDQEIQQVEHFMLDTESVMVKFKPNVPTLIQIQICSSTSSIIMIIELHHLPNKQQQEFQLIKNLFQSLLTNTKQIFSWGSISELDKFLQFDLFTEDQIYLPINRNIQVEYKTYWDQMFPHQKNINDGDCRCRNCFDVGHKPLLGIQDVVAFELNEWLNKQLTCEKFNIGLDPKLKKLNSNGIKYRQSLTNYAANDCDAIFRIITKSNIINNQYLNIELFISPDDDMLMDNVFNTNNSKNNLTPTNESTQLNLEPRAESILNNEQPPFEQPVEPRRPNPLSKEQRQKIHNRSRTIRQRKRAYTYEFIIRNIEKRFPIRTMKQILQKYGVPVTQVKPLTSNRTGETILWVGVKNPEQIKKYETITHKLFSKQHYHQLFHSKQRRHRYDRSQSRAYERNKRHYH